MPNYDRTIDGKKYVEFQFWLVFANGPGAPKVYSREPKLGRNDRSMFMHVTLPATLWSTPSLRGVVKVDDPGLTPLTINADVAADALRQAIGVDVDLVVVPPVEPTEGEQ